MAELKKRLAKAASKSAKWFWAAYALIPMPALIMFGEGLPNWAKALFIATWFVIPLTVLTLWAQKKAKRLKQRNAALREDAKAFVEGHDEVAAVDVVVKS